MIGKGLCRLALLLVIIMMLTGCLTSEYKEYRYTINSDGTGYGSIKYINIVSEEDEEKDVSFKDFGELISDYVEGEQFETDNPNLMVTDKKLYEENGQLCGKIDFTFGNYKDLGFFSIEDCECSPLMYYFGSLSETYMESNGNEFGDVATIPILYWNKSASEVYFKTIVKEDMTDAHSLLELYKVWEKDN